jgi:hypothetical protein
LALKNYTSPILNNLEPKSGQHSRFMILSW